MVFLQIWLWVHFRNYAFVPKNLNSFKTSLPSPQGLPRSWNTVMVSSDSFLCKVLDYPTNWIGKPYSPLEGALPPLFRTLINENASHYRDAPWPEEELSFIV